MKVRRCFVLVPSLTSSGPIRGAVALCRGLIEYTSLPVTLVALKQSSSPHLVDCDGIDVLSLAHHRRWYERYKAYSNILSEAGGRESVVSLSFCLSADFFNSLMAARARIFSSVRGNLLRVYRFDYGLPGIIIALMHYFILYRFDIVLAMSETMANQLKRLGFNRLVIIKNFVDERLLAKYRTENRSNNRFCRFIFLARLTELKRPGLLLEAVNRFKKKGVNVFLDIVGDGPLRKELNILCHDLELDKNVTFHGHASTPYHLLQKADWMILPSETEGVSRSALEALYFGVPCIMRDVDANRDLINSVQQGLLFSRDEELADVMARAAGRLSDNTGRKDCSLLPADFRQKVNVERYVELVSR